MIKPNLFMKYSDSEGTWYCPVDLENKIVYNNMRSDAEAFTNQWLDGVILQIHPKDYLGKLKLNAKKK